MGNDDRDFLFFLDKAKGNNSRDGWGYTAGLDFRQIIRLMSTNT